MGRLRKKHWADKYLKRSKLVINNPNKKINKWFKGDKNNSLWIEIGMGKGQFILKQKALKPKVNFIGIEKYPSVQVIPIKRMEDNKELKLKNIKFISGDAENIQNWFPSESISKIFINFPDPWPKGRHAKRRLLFHKFLLKYYEVLKNDGIIEFKTDQKDLFLFAIEQIEEFTKFKIEQKNLDLHKNNIPIITTEYEEKFINLGQKIYFLKLRKK